MTPASEARELAFRPAEFRDSLRAVAVAAGALPALVALASERWVFGDLRGFPLDDPWIHLVFARALAAGEGLAFDGSLVAGSTAPLWTALLALAGGADWAPLAAKLLGFACHLAGLVLVHRLVRRLDGSRGAAALATVAFGWTDRLVLAALSGMETSLFVVLMMAGLIRHLDERADRADRLRPPVSFLLFGLAALARPEGLLLPLLAALDRGLATEPPASAGSAASAPSSPGGLRIDGARLRRALAGLAIAAAVVAPVALAYLAISGSALPTTLGAKAWGPPRFVPELRHLGRVLGILFDAQPGFTLLAAGGAVALAGRLGGPRDRGLLLPLWTLSMPVASAMLSSGDELLAGNFGRYFFPLLPCVVVLGVVALEPLADGRFRALRLGAVRLPLAALVLVALLAPPLVRAARAVPLYLQARTNVEQTDLAAARWLAAHVAPEARLALVDIGLVQYLLPNPVVDLGGIVSPERQRHLRAARAAGTSWPEALREWLELERPDYVVVFPRWFPLLEREPERFPPLVRFRIRDNVAMAGDELVVYATPWSRPAPPAPSLPPPNP